MAAFDRRDDDEVIASINIIPFVDIVLVLLIIFMVTSTVIVRAAIKVELPRAASAGTEVAATLNVVVTRTGELLVDGRAVGPARASELIRGAAKENPELQAVISADKGLPYGEVVEVIDLVKTSGVRSFALNIERDPAAAGPLAAN
jgi:biopolymer transport protein ExbD